MNGEVDFASLLNVIMSNLDIDMSFVDDLEKLLGVDFDNLNMNELLAKLDTTKSKELEDGSFDIRINFANLIEAQVLCDKNYNIKSARIKDVLIANNTLKFALNVNRMNNVDMKNGEKNEIIVEEMDKEVDVDLSGRSEERRVGKECM